MLKRNSKLSVCCHLKACVFYKWIPHHLFFLNIPSCPPTYRVWTIPISLQAKIGLVVALWLFSCNKPRKQDFQYISFYTKTKYILNLFHNYQIMSCYLWFYMGFLYVYIYFIWIYLQWLELWFFKKSNGMGVIPVWVALHELRCQLYYWKTGLMTGIFNSLCCTGSS